MLLLGSKHFIYCHSVIAAVFYVDVGVAAHMLYNIKVRVLSVSVGGVLHWHGKPKIRWNCLFLQLEIGRSQDKFLSFKQSGGEETTEQRGGEETTEQLEPQ